MEWPYLWEVLEQLVVGTTFINLIKVLYAAPSARIRVNGELSEPVKLHRGTRQGMPLSPLLYALALELLAARIQALPEIVGFKRGQRSEVLIVCGQHPAVSG